MPLTEELGATQQLHEGFGEEETDRQVEPREKAKPFTPPTARMNKTMAERIETMSATRIVGLALTQPVVRADLRLRPSRISSRMRSK